MVVPFLGVYMVAELHFTLSETGVVLSLYGLGAMSGSTLGGWLTDKAGHFKVQLTSVFLSVPVFFLLPLLKEVWSLSIGVFVLSTITETLRPANSVSISVYARPENITRSFSLNRMAVNLGFSIGPALGGVLAAISFKLIFYANGIKQQYRNYPDVNFKNWQNAYYGENYARLQKVKSKYDPGNVFRYDQSIVPFSQ